MSEKTRGGIPQPAALKLLKLRRRGLTVPALAAATGLTPDRVEEVSERLGWPDLERVDQQIRELEELVVMEADTPPPAGPVPATSVPASSSAARPDLKPGEARPSSAPAETLISRGLKSSTKRIVAAAERADKAVATLRELVAADDVKRREEAARAAARQKVESEVKRLAAELEAAKKLLVEAGGKPSSSVSGRVSACAAAGVETRDVRAWAVSAGIKVPATGVIAKAIVDQYVTAMGGAA